MRKFIAVVLAVFVLVPSVSLSENSPAESSYSPDLNMTLSQFMNRYNAISSALGSSLVSLSSSNFRYYEDNDYNSFVFSPDTMSGVLLCVQSKDFDAGNGIHAGIDNIEIFMSNSSDFPSFLLIAKRCAQMFAGDYFAESLAMTTVYKLLIGYYEYNQNDSGFIVSLQLNSIENYYICLEKYSNSDCIRIHKHH